LQVHPADPFDHFRLHVAQRLLSRFGSDVLREGLISLLEDEGHREKNLSFINALMQSGNKQLARVSRQALAWHVTERLRTLPKQEFQQLDWTGLISDFSLEAQDRSYISDSVIQQVQEQDVLRLFENVLSQIDLDLLLSLLGPEYIFLYQSDLINVPMALDPADSPSTTFQRYRKAGLAAAQAA
ncbi:MAG: hypothetical protein Q8Q33_06165, partial [Chlamydiota bacterium]|nr:hypothetical protein [Chlamydiota bacterium]